MSIRAFNIFSIILILVWIWADKYLSIGAPSYGWLLLIYVSVLFCGSYFIRMGFFLKSICSIKTTDQWIALSFDDGPAGSTSQVLDILKENEVEAAFFCIGKKIPGNEELIKRMIREGHIIGNHSFSHHPLFDFFSAGKMLSDMLEMNQMIKDITGLSPRFFRPPYGVTNPNLKKAVMSGGFISIGWSIRSYDTVIKNRHRLLNKILAKLKPGAILLLHDTSETTVAILPELLKAIRSKGFHIVRLDKMANLNPYD
ncbi:MAG TPA: polysaccharide deacetylase family protein [Puia sp.]|nr:polysaccharide deacetylase family protein [Puia sp.]